LRFPKAEPLVGFKGEALSGELPLPRRGIARQVSLVVSKVS